MVLRLQSSIRISPAGIVFGLRNICFVFSLRLILLTSASDNLPDFSFTFCPSSRTTVSGIPRNTQTYAAIQVLAIGISQATAPTTSALAIVVTGQNDGAVRSAVDSDYVCLAIFR